MHPLVILVIGTVVVVCGILFLRLHAFLALIFGALVVALLTTPAAIEDFALSGGATQEEARAQVRLSSGERVAEGFGRTCGRIGIVIAMASIIGECLLVSGAADRIVRSALRLFGISRAPLAFLWSGYLLSIPVFFDTVFYLMVPLTKAMRLRTGANYLLYVLAVVAGATMTHSLVPPTPGPLFAANELRVELGTMILGGCIVGVFTSMVGYLYARWANRRWETPLRESEESMKRLEELSSRVEDKLPPLWLALSPILLPVILITVGATAKSLPVVRGLPKSASELLAGLANQNIALVLAAILALLTLLKYAGGSATSEGIRTALVSAGTIILITGAGGAFGAALQQTGIGKAIEQLAPAYRVSVIPLAFFLTTLIRTAQGSATVAMITATGVFAGLAGSIPLGFHPLYIALAIGCGSKPVWWMNDSGFWVVTRMSGLTEREGLKTLTPISVLMGITGLIIVMLGAWLMPLA